MHRDLSTRRAGGMAREKHRLYLSTRDRLQADERDDERLKAPGEKTDGEEPYMRHASTGSRYNDKVPVVGGCRSEGGAELAESIIRR